MATVSTSRSRKDTKRVSTRAGARILGPPVQTCPLPLTWAQHGSFSAPLRLGTVPGRQPRPAPLGGQRTWDHFQELMKSSKPWFRLPGPRKRPPKSNLSKPDAAPPHGRDSPLAPAASHLTGSQGAVLRLHQLHLPEKNSSSPLGLAEATSSGHGSLLFCLCGQIVEQSEGDTLGTLRSEILQPSVWVPHFSVMADQARQGEPSPTIIGHR